MTIIIGIGQSFIDKYFSIIGNDIPDLNSLIVLLLASIILLVLTNKLPLLLSGIVGGASLQGIGGFGAGMITGAAATAISGAGTMAMSTTAQVSGGVSALKAVSNLHKRQWPKNLNLPVVQVEDLAVVKILVL